MRVRPRVTRLLEPLGKGLARVGMTATAMTVLGLTVVIAGAVVLAAGRLALGGAIVFFGSLLDGLDGAVARATDSVSTRGAFLDAAFDRLGEIASFGGLAFASAGDPRVLLLIVLALGGAMLVPYMRARAEASGVDGRGGLMGRAERILLFSVGLMIGQVEPMLWGFVALVWLTAFIRFWNTYRSIQ
ncbi:MAG: CDP-alcohol phosphatidyltransferase family protein [Acidimicrobiia bacterium]